MAGSADPAAGDPAAGDPVEGAHGSGGIDKVCRGRTGRERWASNMGRSPVET